MLEFRPADKFRNFLISFSFLLAEWSQEREKENNIFFSSFFSDVNGYRWSGRILQILEISKFCFNFFSFAFFKLYHNERALILLKMISMKINWWLFFWLPIHFYLWARDLLCLCLLNWTKCQQKNFFFSSSDWITWNEFRWCIAQHLLFNSIQIASALPHFTMSHQKNLLFFPISVKTMGMKNRRKWLALSLSSYRLTAIVSNPHAGGCFSLHQQPLNFSVLPPTLENGGEKKKKRRSLVLMHRNGFCCVYSIITLTSCRHYGHSPAPP